MPMPWLPVIGLLTFLAAPSTVLGDRPDLVVADFEGETYHPWVASGEALGLAPARGAWPGQMAVEGFQGRGLVNTFRGGDDARGTLTSPPFSVERPFLNFLIGGGKYPGETCLDLVVDGQVVRTATGPNDAPGGSERLDWRTWDVANLVGKSASLRVVDARKGSWGHLCVDQVVQSDGPRGLVPAVRDLPADSPFLRLPIAASQTGRRVRVSVAGQVVRDFDIKLADGPGDFLAFLDLRPFMGKPVRVEAELPQESHALSRLALSPTPVDPVGLYREPGRPQFHFTSRRGWLNDPNGLVFLDGEYHLFYQHNPYGWDWGNMHWGHAVSRDLVHWTELPIALYPRAHGDWAFSGSAVVDRQNTSGFGDGRSPPLVGAYTSTGRGECIIFSLDRGRTWTEYAGNPVVRHEGRDPRLLWHAPSKRWVMAVYDEEAGRRDIQFHSSSDLKTWTFESKLSGFFECPDLFELAVEGRPPGETLWVLSAADGAYLLGQFDGKTFHPLPGGKQKTWHGHFYAAQTFSDEPKGRRVQIGWAQGIAFPGQPFNQQMNVPCELILRPTPDGVRLFANPVPELETLRSNRQTWTDRAPRSGEDLLLAKSATSLDLRLVAEVGPSGKFQVRIGPTLVEYDAQKSSLSVAGRAVPLKPVEGRVRLRILVDRGSVEVFGNDGRVAISEAHQPTGTTRLTGEGTRFSSIEVDELGSSWR